ncbi:Serine protease 55 [Aphelenchoides avenae]|nr:Serine protease 55 [Aphelenchus avenae]
MTTIKFRKCKSQQVRSGGARPGEDTSPIEFPWIVQLLYAGSDRQCAGSLISDRHVLTARRCVDKAGPNERSDGILEAKDISVLYGTRQKYGGMMNVKAVRTYDAKLEKEVLGVKLTTPIGSFSNVARPICLANEFDQKTQDTVFGLHLGNKKRSEDEELTRPLYFDVLYASDRKNCEESLGGDFHKDEFCVSKRNQVYAESIHIGAPITTPNNDGGRWVQVGIALEATNEHNYGSATRVDLYDEVIQQLTHCYINGSGHDYERHCGYVNDALHDNAYQDDYKDDDDANDDDYSAIAIKTDSVTRYDHAVPFVLQSHV